MRGFIVCRSFDKDAMGERLVIEVPTTRWPRFVYEKQQGTLTFSSIPSDQAWSLTYMFLILSISLILG